MMSTCGIMHNRDSIERFYEASRQRLREPRHSLRHLHFAAASSAPQYAGLSRAERYAAAMGDALTREPVMLFADERLVGMLIQTGDQPLPENPPPEAMNIDDYRKKPESHPAGAPGHITWNWRKIIEKGVSGLLEELKFRLTTAPDSRAEAFYRSAITGWNRVLAWNTAHLTALRLKRAAAPATEHTRLDELIRIVEKVPYHPAETFHEALQSFHFQHLAIMFENPFGGNGPGRMDQILGPYLERDLAAGCLTLEDARYLIDELFIRFEERLAGVDGWVESVMTGGLNPDGSSALNSLSYLLIESFMALDQTHPAVYPRLRLDDPPAYWKLCTEYMIRGRNRGQLYNEEAMLSAITSSGVPFADAADYTAGGCMEPNIQGKSCDLNFSGTINIAKIQEEALFAGSKAAYPDFATMYAAFLTRAGSEFSSLATQIDVTGEAMAAYRPTALLSTLIDDCLERGREQHDGGARYYNYGLAPLGITAAADSLLSIKLAVFEEKFITLPELVAVLKNNYAGHEALRQRLRQLPKYGEGNPEADAFCNRVMSDVCTLATSTRTRFGGKVIPMIFNFIWTPENSRMLAARADGSLAGEHISHGMTPQTFAMRNGLTTALKSCGSLNYSTVSGGATTMWDFDHHCAVPELMEPLIRVFFRFGGMVFQGNTTDVDVLEMALQKPEEYPHLIVRVGGFSAHFCSLNRELREEITRRHRHRISS
ncbi:MAG: pyruvate formate lyase family protein [Victivallaceae bacterium]